MENEHPHLTGHEVVGQHGESIGKAADVLYDEVEDRPAWIQVDQGLLHTKHTLVPAEGAYQAENGTVVIPFDKDTVKHAPKVKTPVALTGEVRQKFEEYYGVRS